MTLESKLNGWSWETDRKGRSLLPKLDNLSNFRFAKPETNNEVLEALKQCDLFILPSRKDGLPVALLEAMSVGCVPLVSAFSEGIREVVTPGIGSRSRSRRQ